VGQASKSNPKSAVAYRRLASSLAGQIRSGAIKSGEKLTSEMELVKMHGLSRTTVRLALKELEQNSLIHRRRRAGTFVSPNPGQGSPTRSSFSEFVRNHAARLSREILWYRREKAEDSLASALGVPRGSDGLFFRRLDRLDGVPIAFDDGWILEPYAMRIRHEDLIDFDFSACWRRRTKTEIERTSMELRADAADRTTAEILEIPERAPVLVECDHIFTAEGGACRLITVYRHDQYSFKRVFYNNEKKH